MLTHDELSAAITAHYPDLVHGVDFFVGHPVNGALQIGPAFLDQWGVMERYLEVVRPAVHVPEQIIPAVVDEENPERNQPEQIIPAYDDPAVVVERTKFLSEYPEPSVEELQQWVDDNAEAYALEVAAREARSSRAVLLTAADHAINIAEDTGQPVAPLRAYRQALRQIPEQPGFPFNIEWPVMPAAE